MLLFPPVRHGKALVSLAVGVAICLVSSGMRVGLNGTVVVWVSDFELARPAPLPEYAGAPVIEQQVLATGGWACSVN